VLPGTSRHLVQEAAHYATRLSINLEAPSKSRLNELSSVKDFNSDLIKRQLWIREEVRKGNVKGGQTTQIIVGANDESDHEILKIMDWEYRNVHLHKTYFSAFKPVKGSPLENQQAESITRAFHLYNVDFLMRKYNYKLEEFKLILDKNDNLPKNADPKLEIAKLTIDKPIEINEADYNELLRIPGIGPKAAKRVIQMRINREKIIKAQQLQEIGVIIKRARPFIEIDGERQKMLLAY